MNGWAAPLIAVVLALVLAVSGFVALGRSNPGAVQSMLNQLQMLPTAVPTATPRPATPTPGPNVPTPTPSSSTLGPTPTAVFDTLPSGHWKRALGTDGTRSIIDPQTHVS